MSTTGNRPSGRVRVLLMASGVNSLTQRVWVDLADGGYQVSVSAVADQAQMWAAFDQAQPDVVIAPYLKRAIPESVWSARPCLIVHPGIRGDRGPSSLDWAIRDGENRWGVTVLQANADFDAGDIWAHEEFPMRSVTKSAVYRHEVADAASAAVQQALQRYRDGNFTPTPLDYGRPDVHGRARPAMKQADRALDWSAPTAELMPNLRAGDSSPGVADIIDGDRIYLFGAHEDDYLHGAPGTILGQRHGAICRATGDGAIWIERVRPAEPATLKLPAARVLGAGDRRLPELSLPPDDSSGGRTWRDIRYQERDHVGYLHFDFYNGAMSTSQCRRLQLAYRVARERPTKVIVLMGGPDLWSNGIDLAAVEAAPDAARESWRNINAIDDLVRDIITTDSHLICAAVAGNAGLPAASSWPWPPMWSTPDTASCSIPTTRPCIFTAPNTGPTCSLEEWVTVKPERSPRPASPSTPIPPKASASSTRSCPGPSPSSTTPCRPGLRPSRPEASTSASSITNATNATSTKPSSRWTPTGRKNWPACATISPNPPTIWPAASSCTEARPPRSARMRF